MNNNKNSTTDVLEKSQKISDDWFSKTLPKRPVEKNPPGKKKAQEESSRDNMSGNINYSRKIQLQ